ncbi:uracil-DNA glycosylase-like isoform X1 [Homarus americanus]|uniref:uracil-DNA glycosylase-like isoform X1 n=1 Tax=Homarus americanus TaxID=6706 RepID=UPI001C43A0B8|nr:uracil-DNA glycosylase-like isoform X1 [Homarus americanus]
MVVCEAARQTKPLLHTLGNHFWTSELTCCRSMASQKTIKNFCMPVIKRKSEDLEVNDVTKKSKIDEQNDPSSDPSRTPPTCRDEKVQSGLTPEQKQCMMQNQIKAEIKQQCKKSPGLHENIGHSWYLALKSQFSQPYFEKLSKFLEYERNRATVFPPKDQVFSWTQACKLQDIKVVILGQNPYHIPGQAHGLCFSVQNGVPPPPSLVNMYKELKSDIPGFEQPSHGYLLGWAQQGVLLLNACLTVRAHKANSHKDEGWEKFTDSVIKTISVHNEGVVFLLWGSYAKKKAKVVHTKKHHLLKAALPLFGHRGFFGCKHFSKCNELLEKGGKKPIDWTYLPPHI